MTAKIESFRNGLGETRFRFVTASILHPGEPNRSLRNWRTRSGARAAARRSGFTITR
jgi:hypothetical protein